MTAPATIEIRVEDITQLFNTLDPFPFRDRDLDREAEDFIVGWARELPRAAALRIVIHLSSHDAESERAQQLQDALSRYFTYRAEMTDRELHELFRVGRLSLTIGLTVLAFCTVANTLLHHSFPITDFLRFLTEGLLILGWVANWRPLQIFLYDWWPLRRKRNLYRRLAAADVVLSPYD